MSDQTTYINTFVEQTVETLHSYLNEILQLRTKLKIANNIIAEKDRIIDEFNQNKKNFETDIDELNSTRNNARRWEEQFNAMSQKVSHLDTITAQFNDMKKEYIRKETECDSLKIEIAKLKEEVKLNKKTKAASDKKDINNKDNKSSAVVDSSPVMNVEVTKETDDF